jgi:hypothetical protein
MSVATITRAQYRSLTPEHDLQKAVLRLLEAKGVKNLYWFAIPNAGKRTPREGARMKAEGMRAGVADICVMMDEGTTGWLELKTGKGRQTVEQKAFEAICKRLRHDYAVVRSVEEAEQVLRNWWVHKDVLKP